MLPRRGIDQALDVDEDARGLRGFDGAVPARRVVDVDDRDLAAVVLRLVHHRAPIVPLDSTRWSAPRSVLFRALAAADDLAVDHRPDAVRRVLEWVTVEERD